MTLPSGTKQESKSQTATAPEQAMQQGFNTLGDIQEELDAYVNGHGAVPNWTNLVSRFKATLDQMRQAGIDFGWAGRGS